MAKVNGLNIPKIAINGKNVLRTMRNGSELWAWNELPIGYKEIEYIENNSNSWIDTGFIANGGLKATIGIVPYDSSMQYVFYGSHNPSTNNSDSTWQRNCISILSSTKWEVGQSSNVYSFNASAAPNVKYDVEFSTIVNEAPYVKINGVTYTGKYKSGLSIVPTTSVYIMKDVYYADRYLKGRIYYAKIYDRNLNCVRDYIPVMRSDGVIGLYDRVNKQFYGSSSSTPFTGA